MNAIERRLGRRGARAGRSIRVGGGQRGLLGRRAAHAPFRSLPKLVSVRL